MTRTRFGKSTKTYRVKKAYSKLLNKFKFKFSEDVGSNPTRRNALASVSLVDRTFVSFLLYSLLAQLVEQLTLNQWVAGSSPAGTTIKPVGLVLRYECQIGMRTWTYYQRCSQSVVRGLSTHFLGN